MSESTEAIAQFWSWFSENAEALDAGDDQECVDKLYDAVMKINEGLGVETAPAGDQVELILTCYADPELMELVHELYEARPEAIPGWKVTCYKQARGEPFVLERAGVKIDSEELMFDPLSSPQDRKALGIRLFVPDEVVGHDEEDDILWDIVITQAGEEVAATILHVLAQPFDKKSGDELPLSELGGYVKWHVKRHHKKSD